ncbi:glycosyltransferase family 9 protein [Candidatus Pseudothioglobus singularis]|nr:glycosyltransferase family 9 protein [Candidatus Pseudothioglobus singularis]
MLGFEKTYTLPFKYEIPNYISVFLEESSITKRCIKFIKRYIYLTIKRQTTLEIYQILPKHRNILWINLSAPSFGDSLMDLSSRELLKGKNIDLFTTDRIAKIFRDDKRFKKIYSNIGLASKNSYSLVIVDSYSTRSIKAKFHIAPKVNFIGMYGYFNGPEVNRVLFSFHQMNHLLGYPKSESEINSSARSSMSISTSDKDIVNKINLPEKYIAVALGGEWSYRSYQNWSKVIENILKKNFYLNIVLIGSGNAHAISKKIFLQFSNANITNCVDRYSFNQTAQIISQSDILICCDGGLMHAANSLNKTIIPLFARLTPEMQLTDCINAFPLFDDTNVNNIKIEDVIEKYNEAINY